LVLTGLQSDDQGFGQVGVVLAERLRMPHVSLAVALEVSGDALRVKRELEGGWFQWIGLPMPALVTVQSGINQLRYATLKGIMAAKKKEIQVITADAPEEASLRVISIETPTRTRQTEFLTGPSAARDLVSRLRQRGILA